MKECYRQRCGHLGTPTCMDTGRGAQGGEGLGLRGFFLGSQEVTSWLAFVCQGSWRPRKGEDIGWILWILLLLVLSLYTEDSPVTTGPDVFESLTGS